MGASVDVVVGGGVHEETGLVAMAIRTSRSCKGWWGCWHPPVYAVLIEATRSLGRSSACQQRYYEATRRHRYMRKLGLDLEKPPLCHRHHTATAPLDCSFVHCPPHNALIPTPPVL